MMSSVTFCSITSGVKSLQIFIKENSCIFNDITLSAKGYSNDNIKFNSIITTENITDNIIISDTNKTHKFYSGIKNLDSGTQLSLTLSKFLIPGEALHLYFNEDCVLVGEVLFFDHSEEAYTRSLDILKFANNTATPLLNSKKLIAIGFGKIFGGYSLGAGSE